MNDEPTCSDPVHYWVNDPVLGVGPDQLCLCGKVRYSQRLPVRAIPEPEKPREEESEDPPTLSIPDIFGHLGGFGDGGGGFGGFGGGSSGGGGASGDW